MHTIRKLTALPDNLDEFIKEMALGYGNLYGVDAEHWYTQSVGNNLKVAIGHDSVYALSAYSDGIVVGVVFCHHQHFVGHISLLHVLRDHCGKGIEHDLLHSAVHYLREQGLDTIICEVIPFFEADYSKTLLDESFLQFHRALMAAPLVRLDFSSQAGLCSKPLKESELAGAAEILVLAYENHPDRMMHTDIHDADSAERYIRSVMAGEFGRCHPSYCRSLYTDTTMKGVILGFEACPTVGFVMQVAVASDFQNKGVGTCLLRDQANAFMDQGVKQFSLGVTLDNPAQKLYERLGLSIKRHVNTFIWDSKVALAHSE